VTAAGGPALDRRRVELPSSIKSTGTHTVTVRVHPEVSAALPIEVVSA
jgi:large subunit ribosomal protein L9